MDEEIEASENEIDAEQTADQDVLLGLIAAVLFLIVATIPTGGVATVIDQPDIRVARSELRALLSLNVHSLPDGISFAQINAAIDTAARKYSSIASNPFGVAGAIDHAAVTALKREVETAIGKSFDAAIARALNGRGDPMDRASHLKRSIALSDRQQQSLTVMRDTLMRFAKAKTEYVAATANRPGFFRKLIDVNRLIADTRGKISAAQRQLLKKAMTNARLTPRQANVILDRHADALRKHRVKAIVTNGLHELSEQAKLKSWQDADAQGRLPKDYRRFWRTAQDERVRFAHSATAGLNAAGVPLGEPFATPLGPRMFPPLEINCRCRAILRKTNVPT